VTFIAKTIAEEFPDFDRVIPKDNTIDLTFNRQALLASLQRIEITAAEESGAVTFRATSDESAARINSSSKDKGEAEERVRLAKVPSEAIEISFKAEYLIDVLKRMDSEQIALWLATSEKAGLIEPTGDGISPLRVLWLFVVSHACAGEADRSRQLPIESACNAVLPNLGSHDPTVERRETASWLKDQHLLSPVRFTHSRPACVRTYTGRAEAQMGTT